MNVKNALTVGAQKLKHIDSAQLDAEVLLSFVINKSKEFLYAHPETKLNWIQKIRFFYLINQRSKNWPVAYLTGIKEFYGRTFYVNKNVLIPRPLTEELIEKALAIIKLGYSICDLGTGSGCIIITIIKELQKQNYNLNNFKFYASDISRKALQVAKKNARFHQVNQHIQFLQGDLLKPLPGKKIALIIANLPYLEANDLNEPSIKKEPTLALLGNYDEFFKQASRLIPQPAVIYEDKSGIHLKK